jgi:hypothetical protein
MNEKMQQKLKGNEREKKEGRLYDGSTQVYLGR